MIAFQAGISINGIIKSAVACLFYLSGATLKKKHANQSGKNCRGTREKGMGKRGVSAGETRNSRAVPYLAAPAARYGSGRCQVCHRPVLSLFRF